MLAGNKIDWNDDDCWTRQQNVPWIGAKARPKACIWAFGCAWGCINTESSSQRALKPYPAILIESALETRFRSHLALAFLSENVARFAQKPHCAGQPTLNSMWWLLALSLSLAETRDVPHAVPSDGCTEGSSFLQTQAAEVRRGGRVPEYLELKAMGQKVWKDIPLLELMRLMSTDMNGRFCNMCGHPDPQKPVGNYAQRKDCGNHSVLEHPESLLQPIADFNKGNTNGWCELNMQKVCADALYNKNFLIQAKQINTTGSPVLLYDANYCYHNGWLEADYRSLQLDYEGMKAKADKFCEARREKIKSITMAEMAVVYLTSFARGKPSKEEAQFVADWTCAMGSSGCDMTYCAYSFCKKPDGTFGTLQECPGWDSDKGMPV